MKLSVRANAALPPLSSFLPKGSLLPASARVCAHMAFTWSTCAGQAPEYTSERFPACNAVHTFRTVGKELLKDATEMKLSVRGSTVALAALPPISSLLPKGSLPLACACVRV